MFDVIDPLLFTPLAFRVDDLADGRVRVSQHLRPGARPCEAFFRGSVGALRGAPAQLELPMAEVEIVELRPDRLIADVRLPESRTFAHRARSAAVRLATRVVVGRHHDGTEVAMTVAAPDSDPAEHRLDQAAVAWTLTPRQAEVLAQVVAGRANKEIANQLCAGLIATLLVDGKGLRRITKWIASAFRHPIRFARAAWPFGFARQTLILLVMQTIDATLKFKLRRRWFWPFRRLLCSDGERIPTNIPQANAFAERAAQDLGGIPLTSTTEICVEPTCASPSGGWAVQDVCMSDKIVDLRSLDTSQLESVAALTHAAAREHAPTWLPTIADAHVTIAEARDRFGRVMLGADGSPIGWIAAGHAWGRIWDLHPLIVDVAHQRRGVGRTLVREVEREATRAGALVLSLGTSDTTHATSVSEVDLFDEPLRRLASLSFRASHSTQFWLRIGFKLVGVIPDAEGPGQPSLQLAKRLPPEE